MNRCRWPYPKVHTDHELENMVVGGNVAAERRGLHYAFVLSSLVVSIGGVLSYSGKDAQGHAAIDGTLVTLASVFVYGSVPARSRTQAQVGEE